MNTVVKRDRDILAIGLYIAYFVLIPLWLINVSLEQFIIFYVIHWFWGDVVMSLFQHRWSAHNLWNPPAFIQKVLTILSTIVFNNTPIAWSAFHRTHHRFSDTEKDPHSPNYQGWFRVAFLYRLCRGNLKYAIDRLRDPFFRKVEQHEIPIIITSHTIAFIAIYYTLGFQWWLTLWAIPIATSIFSINFFINVLAHRSGEAKDYPWLWPIVFSEAYHGSHHKEVKLSYTKWDPAGWIIRKLGWT